MVGRLGVEVQGAALAEGQQPGTAPPYTDKHFGQFAYENWSGAARVALFRFAASARGIVTEVVDRIEAARQSLVVVEPGCLLDVVEPAR